MAIPTGPNPTLTLILWNGPVQIASVHCKIQFWVIKYKYKLVDILK